MAISLYELSLKIDASMPLGTIIAYYGTDEPLGWKICDGRDCSGTELATKLGITKVPDLRGRFIRMIGGNAAAMAVAQVDEFKSHQHSLRLAICTNQIANNSPNAVHSDNEVNGYQLMNSNNYAVATGGVETRPINMAFNYIIKVSSTAKSLYYKLLVYNIYNIAINKISSLLSKLKEV